MPRGDRTGRFGFGALSGRRLGYCAGYDRPGYMNNYPMGMGMGMGRGARGRFMGMGRFPMGGYMNSYPFQEPYFSDKDEKDFLSNQAKVLQEQLEDIKGRLKELEKKED